MVLHCSLCLLRMQIRNNSTNAAKSMPRITLPHKIVNKLDRTAAKDSAKKYQGKRVYKGHLVISCKRKQFNHYQGQTYSDFSPQHLASGGWKHRKSVGDYFTINAYDKNPAVSLRERFDNFDCLGLNKALVKTLELKGITEPTNVQALVIPPMFAMKNVICAAETGSGKTLAYLLPIYQKILRYKMMHYSRDAGPNSPYAVILTPSRELADQIHVVAKGMSEEVNCLPHVICGGRGTQKILRNPPKLDMDLLVTTPGVLSKLLTNRIISTSRLLHIVFDEVDTLLDDSFNEKTIRIIQKLKITSEKIETTLRPEGDCDETVTGIQVAMVGATMPRALSQILQDIVPLDTMEIINTSHLHKLMPHVPQKFVRVGPSSRPDELVKVLKDSVEKGIPTIVFCNKSATANYLGHFLTESGIDNMVFHGNMSQKNRDGRFAKFQDGQTKLLIATDIASRGLDTIQAERVINFEFPHFMSDYIHRVGRVGRVGSHQAGSVVSFVSHKWNIDLLWKIETAARRQTELDNVNANIKRKLNSIQETKYGTGD